MLKEIKFHGYNPDGRIIAWQDESGNIFAANRDDWNGELLYRGVEQLPPDENGWVEFPGTPAPDITPVLKQIGEFEFEIIGYKFV